MIRVECWGRDEYVYKQFDLSKMRCTHIMQQFHYIIIELGSSAISDICEKGHRHCMWKSAQCNSTFTLNVQGVFFNWYPPKNSKCQPVS